MENKEIKEKTPVILLVEDNLGHAEMIMRSFGDCPIANKVYHLCDGEAALDYLFQRGNYKDARKSPHPHVVLLDLRLPKIDGLDVLREIKNSPKLRKIPVIILTTSEAEKDVARAYNFYANSYLVKPFKFEEFTEMINDIGVYWLGWNYNPQP